MFTICLADHIFNIDNKYPYTEQLCKDYLTADRQGDLITVSDDEIAAENSSSTEFYSSDYLESLAVYRKICEILIRHNTMLFHCSALMVDDRAYLFTAPSGTGKSTHTRMWRERFGSKVTMINDDKPLLRFVGEDIFVYGTPYSGKHSLQTNTSAKVAGTVILSQGENNLISPMTPKDAFPTLLSQTYRINDPNAIRTTLELVSKLSQIPTFFMSCNISHEAAEVAYNALKGNNHEAN